MRKAGKSGIIVVCPLFLKNHTITGWLHDDLLIIMNRHGAMNFTYYTIFAGFYDLP